MRCQQARKQLWLRGHAAKCASSQGRISIQKEQEPAHGKRPLGDLPVGSLIILKVALCDGLRKLDRLVEAQAEPFPGYGVDATGSVSSECNVPAVDAGTLHSLETLPV